MGCVNSRTDINDLHPNIFQVMNVDDLGNLVTPGRLEVTESDIVLYQRGKQPIKWPLRCLRRYGYDAEIFSFESGRRCSTGPGIYAFKCRRAAHLFNLVQANIQVCNNSGDDNISREHPVASHPGVNPMTGTRVTIPVEPNYLDPILNRATTNNRAVANRVIVDHRNHQNGVGRLDSVGSSTALISPQRNINSPTSPPALPPPPPPPPTSATQQLPRSHPSSSLYVNEEILSSLLPLEMVERNNNKSLRGAIQRSCTVTNSISDGGSVFSLEATDKSSDTVPRIKSPGTGAYMNIDIDRDAISLLSPGRGRVPDAAMRLNIKQDVIESSGHAYMNISPGQEHVESVSGGGGVGSGGRPRSSSTLPPIVQPQEAAEEAARHCYANLEPSEIESLRKRFSAASVSENRSPVPPSTPTTITGAAAIREVNYAVLDLDTKEATVTAVGSPVDGPPSATPPESPNKLQQKGYATIDFNKTAALSHSVNPNLVNDNEGSRKTRHNSTISALGASVRRSSSVSE